MRILCVIDHFGSGGAQRQMVTLASALKDRGHDVECFIYFPQHRLFIDSLVERNIVIHEHAKGRGFSAAVVKRLLSLMRSGGYDIVLSYLGSPNVYTELAHLFARGPKLVVSERGSHFGDRSRLGAFIRRNFHRFADHIVVNSESHSAWLRKQFPWMTSRLSVIYNGFDLHAFEAEPNVPRDPREVRLISIGRVDEGKNVITLIEALRHFHRRHGWVPHLSWVGRREDISPATRAYCDRVDGMLDSTPDVKAAWHWLGERNDVPQLLREHHALIHATLHEGLPNVICEALASGRPVLASDVCDNRLLVPDGTRGFLFDPQDAEGIAASIQRLIELDPSRWRSMSLAARDYANAALSIDRMTLAYEQLFSNLVANRPHERLATA